MESFEVMFESTVNGSSDVRTVKRGTKVWNGEGNVEKSKRLEMGRKPCARYDIGANGLNNGR